MCQLEKAIRAKLTAQAEFVFWWDTKGPGSIQHRRPKKGNRSVTVPRAGEDGLPGKMIVSRWRRKLNDADKFEATYADAVSRYVIILEAGSGAHVSHNTGEVEWYKSADYVDAARAVLGEIDLDPASTVAANGVIKAKQIFTRADDGLSQPWAGRLWMNPPYSETVPQKPERRLLAGILAAVLTPVVPVPPTRWLTDAIYLHELEAHATSGFPCLPHSSSQDPPRTSRGPRSKGIQAPTRYDS